MIVPEMERAGDPPALVAGVTRTRPASKAGSVSGDRPRAVEPPGCCRVKSDDRTQPPQLAGPIAFLPGSTWSRAGGFTFQPGDDALVVLASILDRGLYISQFVTGTSNGGLTAFAGGDRWHFGSRESSVEPMTMWTCSTVRSTELLTSTATPMVRHRDSGRPTCVSVRRSLRERRSLTRTAPLSRSSSVADRMGLVVLTSVTTRWRMRAAVWPRRRDSPRLCRRGCRNCGAPEIGARTWSTSRSRSPRIWRTQCNRPIPVARARRVGDSTGAEKVWHCLARFGRTW